MHSGALSIQTNREKKEQPSLLQLRVDMEAEVDMMLSGAQQVCYPGI